MFSVILIGEFAMNFRGDGASTEAIAADLNSTNTAIEELSICETGPFLINPEIPFDNKWLKSGMIRTLINVNKEVPPEITRIKNGVLFVSAGIPPGVGILMQNWFAYDLERAVFVSIEGKSYEHVRPKPERPIRNNEMYRYVKNGNGLHRAEKVTVVAANLAQARNIACNANRLFNLKKHDHSEKLLRMPNADGMTYISLIKDGLPLKGNSADGQIKITEDNLMKILYQIFHPED